MPHLQIRNRYWLIGGDELFVPGILSIIGRFLWAVIIFFIIYLDFNRLLRCAKSLLILVYLIVSASLFLLAILSDLLIVLVSLRGTMIETYKRKSVNYLIAFRGLLVFIQLLCAMTGIIGISLSSQIPCDATSERTDANKAILSIVVISQFVDVLIQSCCCYLISTNNVSLYGPNRGDEDTDLKQWESRFRAFIRNTQVYCCNTSAIAPNQQNDSNNMEAVAKVLTKLFHHDGFLDVVPSDVLAGMILLRIQQRSQRKAASETHYSQTSRAERNFPANAETKNDLLATNEYRRDLNIVEATRVISDETSSNTLTNVQISTAAVSRRRYIATLPQGRLRPLREVSSMPVRSCTVHRVSDTIAFAQDIDLVSNLLHYVKYAALLYTYITPLESSTAVQACLTCQECYYAFNPTYVQRPGIELLCWCWLGSTRVSFPTNLGDEERGIKGISTTPLVTARRKWSFNFSSKSSSRSPNPLSSPSVHTPQRTSGSTYHTLHAEPLHYYCAWNRSGLNVGHEALPYTELVALSDRNDMIHKPYAVFLDHARHMVVIAIRGTVSLEDCVTDVLCDPAEMTVVGMQWGFQGEGRFAHGGLLRAAQEMRMELHEAQLLQEIYGKKKSAIVTDQPGAPMVSIVVEEGKGEQLRAPLGGKFEHYGLVVTGHSLGAGAAVLLTILLKDEFPHVMCYAYGTPGAVLDRQSCLDVKEYVKSVVLGNDIVSRVSLNSLSKLRNDVLDMIARAKVNKMVILTAFCRDLKAEDVLYSEEEAPYSEFKVAVDQFKEACERKQQLVNPMTLYHPGQILHLVKSRMSHTRWKKAESEYELLDSYAPTLSDTEGIQYLRTSANSIYNKGSSSKRNLAFSKSQDPGGHGGRGIGIEEQEGEDMDNYTEIAVSGTMVKDHLPDQYYDALYQLLCTYYARV